jgi:hypothetical protein
MLLPHVLRCYLKCQASGDASGYDFVPRGAGAPQGVSTLVDPLWNNLAPFYKPSDASFGITTLDHLVSGSWIPIYSQATTVVGTSSNANRAAFGRCIACKTTGNKHLKLYFYESDLFVAAKLTSKAAGSVRDQDLWEYMVNTDGSPTITDAWMWRVSRGGEYADRLLAMIDDSNEKLRRVRHVK